MPLRIPNNGLSLQTPIAAQGPPVPYYIMELKGENGRQPDSDNKGSHMRGISECSCGSDWETRRPGDLGGRPDSDARRAPDELLTIVSGGWAISRGGVHTSHSDVRISSRPGRTRARGFVRFFLKLQIHFLFEEVTCQNRGFCSNLGSLDFW